MDDIIAVNIFTYRLPVDINSSFSVTGVMKHSGHAFIGKDLLQGSGVDPAFRSIDAYETSLLLLGSWCRAFRLLVLLVKRPGSLKFIINLHRLLTRVSDVRSAIWCGSLGRCYLRLRRYGFRDLDLEDSHLVH